MTAPHGQLVDEATYLANEEGSVAKHEYVEGVVYAMAGGSVAHHLIASNVLVALGSALRGKPCRAFNSDMLVRIRRADGTRFYYPDAMVVCRSNPATESYQDEPVIIVEVLSDRVASGGRSPRPSRRSRRTREYPIVRPSARTRAARDNA